MNRKLPTIILIVIALTQLVVAAQPSAGSRDIVFRGEVVNQSGTGIPDATVHLVVSATGSMGWLGELNPIRGHVKAESDRQGNFVISFGPSDRQMIVTGPMTLVVSAPGYQRSAQTIEYSRVQCDAPFVVRLKPEKPVVVRLTDAAGKPLPDAKVYPASHHGTIFPLCIPSVAGQTGNDGAVTLSETHPNALTRIVAEHPAIGQQLLAVARNADSMFNAQAAPVRKVTGRILAADEARIPGLENIKLLVMSCDLDKSQYPYCGWDFVSVAADGSFEIPQLAVGHLMQRISCPATFGWREQYNTERDRLEVSDEPYEWELKFQAEPRLSVTVLDEQSDRPLPNLQIMTIDGRLEPTATDERGKASFYRFGARSAYFPADPTGEYFSQDTFYQYAKTPPVDNVVEFPPYRLARRTRWVGRVVDEAGEPFPAARVSYEYSVERFKQTSVVYANSDGSFSLRGVADGTAVKLKADTASHASEMHNVLLPESNGLELVLKKQPFAQPVGRIVGLDGKPVADVAVAIKRFTVIQEEKYAREEVRAVELYKTPETIRTDEHGRFMFPTTKDYNQRLQVEISDPRFFSFRSPMIDGGRLEMVAAESGIDRIDLGEFRIMAKPSARDVVVQVRTESGEPISGASIVLVGGRTGKATGTTAADGKAMIPLADGKCVVAVEADGHLIHFGSLLVSRDSHQPTIVLQPSAGGPSTEAKRLDAAEYNAKASAVARRLFERMRKPDLDNTSLHRIGLYGKTLASLDPQQFTAFALKLSGKPALAQGLVLAADTAIRRKPELVELAANSNLVPNQYLSGLYLSAVAATEDDDQRLDWLGEAMVITKHRHMKSAIVSALLAAEEFDLAAEYAQEYWDGLTDLQELVAANKREQKIGDARMVGPALAILDLQAAHRLIQLTASEDEIEPLKTQATLNWGLVHRSELLEQLGGKIDSAGVENWMRRIVYLHRLGFEGLPSAEKIAELIEAPSTRFKFLLVHAKLTTDLLLRERLLKQAVETVKHCKVDADALWASHLNTLVEEEALVESLPRSVRDQIIFISLKNLPPKMEGERVHGILANAARVVAMRDRQLGRTLLEPSFQDRGWMFGRYTHGRSDVTNAAARIDPDWAMELAEDLCDAEFRHDVVDQLELRAGMIQELMK